MLKCFRDRREADSIAGRHNSVVPFDPAAERRVTNIGATDEGDAIIMWKMDDVGLGMKSRLSALEYSKLDRARSAHRMYLEVE